MPDPLRIYCDSLARFVSLPKRPQRIISLVSSLTETIFEIGHGERVAGVSSYCPRYVPNLTAPIVGDYLFINETKLAELQPDLVLTTTGVQREVGRKLAEKGFPVFSLPLPNSLHGICENIVTLGGLMDEVDSARALADRIQRFFLGLRADSPAPRKRIYAECWFGKHPRTPGGLTFIHDILTAAGGENIYGNERQGYLRLDPAETWRRKPDVMVLFTEPECPVDAQALLNERGWQGLPVIESNITRGHNIIHDGVSIMETAAWLKEKLS